MDGWKLDEHKVDVLARNACTCYVASYPGKVRMTFIFRLKLEYSS